MNLDLHIYLGYFSGKFGDVIITGDGPTVIWVNVEEQFAKKERQQFSPFSAVRTILKKIRISWIEIVVYLHLCSCECMYNAYV